jgi:hypothetical protein
MNRPLWRSVIPVAIAAFQKRTDGPQKDAKLDKYHTRREIDKCCAKSTHHAMPNDGSNEDLRDEVTQLRNEVAKYQALSTRNHKQIMEAVSPSTEKASRARGPTVSANNRTVKSETFMVPIGLDAEEHPDFESTWVALLRSSLIYEARPRDTSHHATPCHASSK